MSPATSAKKRTKTSVVFHSQLPLVNPETLFTTGTWVATLDFIADYLSNHGKTFDPNLTITIRDLYFSKVYNDKFDFKKTQGVFSKLGSASLHEISNNDRNDELIIDLGFPENANACLYKFRGATTFSMNGAVSSQRGFIKSGRFLRKSFVWSVTTEKFIGFIDALEKTLMGQGRPSQCRAFMEIAMSNATIDVQCFYEESFPETYVQAIRGAGGMDIGMVASHHKYIWPRFLITI